MPLVLRGMYQAIAPIGQGGMGRTFRAINLDKFNQPCVIKQFLPQIQSSNISSQMLRKATELFNREAKQLYELGRHPQIPELFASFAEQDQLYLVQELIEGQTLAAELQANGAFSPMAIAQLLNDLLTVLQFIHDRGVIHRDIKPENIIRRDRDHLPVLVDFGAAKVAAAATTTATVIGSLDYTAPEQLRGKPIFASDLYSLGVTCIQLLTNVTTGELFCDRRDAWIWRQFLPQPLSEQQEATLGKVLDQLICRAVADRYKTAIAALVDLQANSNPKNGSANSPRPANNQISNVAAKQPSASARGKITPATPTAFKRQKRQNAQNKQSNQKPNTNNTNSAIAKYPSSRAPIKSVRPMRSLAQPQNSSQAQNLPTPNNLSNYVVNQPGQSLNHQLVPAYGQLQQLLEAGAWQEADSLTNAIILQLLDRAQLNQISKGDIHNFPCVDLLHLDRLWTGYSSDRFGFTVQLEIWQSLGGLIAYNAENYWQFADTYLKFAPKVGWQIQRPWFIPSLAEPQWRKYEDFIFSRQAPYGHLPSFGYGDGYRLLDSLFARLSFCN